MQTCGRTVKVHVFVSVSRYRYREPRIVKTISGRSFGKANKKMIFHTETFNISSMSVCVCVCLHWHRLQKPTQILHVNV